MKPIPRLLPLVAVAIGGVLAVKALSDVAAAPQLFAAAGARAEEAPSSAKHASPLPPNAGAAPPPASVHACAQSPAELAKAAGLSPGELQTLQNLGARRGQIDDRERMLDTQLQLLAAAETKVDSKMKALNGVKAEIQAMLGQADQQQQAEIDRLVTVYEKMKPANAAAVFATLDDKVRIPVAAKMKVSALSQILAQMQPSDAKKLTESLAHRYSAAETLSEAAQAPPPSDAKAGPSSPGKLAAAGPPDAASSGAADKAQEGGEDTAKAPIKIHMTVKRPGHRKPLMAHVKHDTPTLAAAKAAASQRLASPARPPQQTAAALKPAPLSTPASHTAPATAATPPSGVPTIG
jgi:flagellar motility protein MotE (MotC chaperone)